MATVKIPVVRVGDTSKVSVVRVHTKDGSATSGEDYYPVSQGTAVFKQVWLSADIVSAQLCFPVSPKKGEDWGRRSETCGQTLPLSGCFAAADRTC